MSIRLNINIGQRSGIKLEGEARAILVKLTLLSGPHGWTGQPRRRIFPRNASRPT